jgi:Arc/MetJ-type ribon-helix-helix transcriptional regulator
MAILNVNLGGPYEAIIQRAIKSGYAANQSEAVRQALRTYNEWLNEEEMRLVAKKADEMMAKIETGELQTVPLDEALKGIERRRFENESKGKQ